MPSLNPFKNRNNENDIQISPNDIIKENDQKIFEDMEEIKGDIYSGVGIKKMKAYKCDLKIDELNKQRELFWKIKTNHNNKNWTTWNTIKRAVLFDELRASLLLEEYKITPVNGCINHLIDSKGNYYKIPNYCINDPYFEKIIVDENNVKEEKIKIKLYGWKNLEIEINNKLKGKDLKNEIRMKEKIEEGNIIKLFYKGAEIKDDDYLYKHDLNENYPVMLKVFNNS
jgi:hypothetical protein